MRAEIREREPVDVVAVAELALRSYWRERDGYVNVNDCVDVIRAALSTPKPVTLADIRDGGWFMWGGVPGPLHRDKRWCDASTPGAWFCDQHHVHYWKPLTLTGVTRLREVGARWDADKKEAVVILEEW